MEWYLALAIIGVAFLVLLILGVPLAVAMGVVGGVYIMALIGSQRGLEAVSLQLVKTLTSYNSIPIMLFVLIGELMLLGGFTEDIFDVASKWLNRLPGGLALVTIGSCAIFATCSGSSAASASTIGRMSVPEMLKRGYDKRLSVATIAAAGGLAHLIPPSVLMVVYATFIEVPVGEMLMAGVVPGVLLVGAYAAVAITWALVKPSAVPREAAVSWKARLFSLRKIIGPLLIMLAVLGTIYTGVATVNEASVMGAVIAFILLTARRRFSWQGFGEALRQTVLTTSFILFIIVGATLFSWVLNYFMIPQRILDYAVALNLTPIGVILIFMLLYLVLGMFMDTIGQIFVTMPIVLPILLALGFSPIWFGILFFITVEIGMVTPPYGILLYIVKGIAPPGITFGDIVTGYIRSFFIADLGVLALVLAFPVLALWLPGTMY